MMDWSKILTASVAPIVIISACGLLCLAFYNRLAAIVSRLRTFQRERLHEQDGLAQANALAPQDEAQQMAAVRHQRMLDILDLQTKHVLRRAHLIQRTLMCLLATIGCLIMVSLASGLSLVWPEAMYIASAAFVVGMVLMLAGIVYAMLELSVALDPIEEESLAVRDLEHASEVQLRADLV